MINKKEISIGDFVTHNKAGRIEVDSIFLHCETYAIGYKGGVTKERNKFLEAKKLLGL